MTFAWDTFVKTAIILSGTTVLTVALSRASAATRYTVWLLGISAALALPLASVLLPDINLPLLDNRVAPAQASLDLRSTPPAYPPRIPGITLAAPRLPFPPEVPAALTAAAKPSGWQWPLLVWCLGAGIALVRTLLGFREIQALRRGSTPWREPFAQGVLADALEDQSLEATIELRAGTETVPPMTWGILRPTILLPATAAGWTRERLNLVIAHELAHVKRSDGLTQIVSQVACVVHWFNPLVWYGIHRMRVEREHACDDRVLALGAGAEDYADHLLGIARTVNYSHTAAVLSMVHPSQLEKRLRRILNSATNRQVPGVITTAMMVAIGVSLTATLAAAHLTALPLLSLPEFPLAAAPAPVHSIPVPPPAPQSAPTAAVPQTTETPAINLISNEKEIAMGRELAAHLEKEIPLVNDAVINAYVNGVGQVLVRNSDAKIPFSFKVIKSAEVNAIALPGGLMYVNTGLILSADNEAELASVMAHLIGHVTARHGAANQSKGELVNIATIPLIFLGGPLGTAIRQPGGMLIPPAFYLFSKRAESEADYLGLQYAYKAGYDPKAAITYSTRLEAREAAKPGTISKLFATHPLSDDRLNIEKVNIDTVLPALDHYVLTTPQFDEVRKRVAALD